MKQEFVYLRTRCKPSLKQTSHRANRSTHLVAIIKHPQVIWIVGKSLLDGTDGARDVLFGQRHDRNHILVAWN